VETSDIVQTLHGTRRGCQVKCIINSTEFGDITGPGGEGSLATYLRTSALLRIISARSSLISFSDICGEDERSKAQRGSAV
jgi:hypothetical protein